MADPGEGEAAMQRTAQAGIVKRLGAHLVEESCRGDHRPHRVRRGRADAHLEHVEDG
jgi:hypothetical protein